MPKATNNVLELQGLAKSYGRQQALRGLTLTVAPGQVFGILGPNGSGKTTALGIALGALRADQGTVSWFGTGSHAKARRRIGALLEQPCFYPWLTGEANLRIFAAVKGLPASAVQAPLQRVGLWEARAKAFQSYSLGMKQRLALAEALLGSPEALVLDEPTNGVDAQGIFEVRSLITDYAKAGGTVVLASHLLDEVEKVCTHVAILRTGAVVKTGTIGAVLGADGWIEAGASDLGGLERLLRAAEPGLKIERREAWLEVHGSKFTPEDLNAKAAARGIVLGHLVRQRPTLETQYLDLVGPGGPPS